MKGRKYCSSSIWNRIISREAIGEINKTEQYTAKKVGQNNQDNATRTKNTKEQNKANQVGKPCYACKAEENEIKHCKKRRNILPYCFE